MTEKIAKWIDDDDSSLIAATTINKQLTITDLWKIFWNHFN